MVHYGGTTVELHAAGDLVVRVEVRIPTRLTKDQKRLFEELAETLPVNNEPHEKGLFAKVKDYFM